MSSSTHINSPQARWAAGLAGGVVLVGGMVWAVNYWRDRQTRQEVKAVIERFAKLPGFDIEGRSDRSNVKRPTPEEIDKLVGKPPDMPINRNAARVVAKYSWSSPHKEFSIYVIFRKNPKTQELEMAKGHVYGNP